MKAGSDSACVSFPMYSGPLMPWLLPVFADRLRDGQDVRLVERAAERRAPVAAGAEAHALG